MHKKLGALACICVSMACSISWAQSDSPAPKPPIKREVFLVLAKASLNGACDVPNSPFACMVKNVESCHKYLPIAIDQCGPKMEAQLPAEIKSEETRKWSTYVSRCIVDEYVVLVGPADLNPAGCPRVRQ